jgi:peptidoglycan/LPS O-acetylase OafA/YrhL
VKSANREYLPAVDHLRAAAAVLVVLYHSAQLLRSEVPGQPSFDPQTDWVYSANPLQTIIIEGHSGVALFMVLSGFILTTGTLGRTIEYRHFLTNRLLRVGPLYVVLLLFAAGAASSAFSLLGALQTTLGFATFPGGFTAGPFALVLWTVGVEIQFYLVFPLLARLLNERGTRTLLLLLTCLATLRTLAVLTAPQGSNLNDLTYFSIVGRIDQFLIGMVAAVVFTRYRQRLGHPIHVLSAGAAAVAMLWTFNQLHGYAEPTAWRAVWVDVEGLVWAAVIVTYVSYWRFGRGRLSRVLAELGARSYSIYLVHMPVLYLVSLRGWHVSATGLPPIDALLTGLVLVLPITVALSTLTYAAIEQPFLTLRGRYVPTPANGGTSSSAPVLPAPHPRSAMARSVVGRHETARRPLVRD